MRVLLVSDMFMPGSSGLITAVRQRAETLRSAGVSVGLICPGSSESREWAEHYGIELFATRGLSIPRGVSQRLAVPTPGLLELCRLALKRRDVVDLHSPGLLGAVVQKLASHRGCPVVATTHLMPSNLLGFAGLTEDRHRVVCLVIDRVNRATLGRVEIVVAPTAFAAELLRDAGCAPPIRVVSNGLPAEAFSRLTPRELSDKPSVSLLYVGRLQLEKRVDELLALSARAIRRGVDLTCTIVGSGPDASRLRRLVVDSGLQDYFRFTGHVSREAVVRELARATVFCMPSRAELQSCAVLEAMASGLPVLAARAGALPETAPDGKAGFLYEPGNVEDFDIRLHQLIGDPTTYSRCSRGALEQAHMHHLEQSCKRILDIYEAARAERQISVPRRAYVETSIH